jgi:hypothetical protein
MRKLRRRRCLELFIVVAAMALVAVIPAAGALAAGEESGGSTVGETGSESSSGSTGSAPPAAEEASSTATPPASTGWVPQGEGTEASSHEASTRHGSSLGSGASPKQAGSAGEQAGSAGEESSYSGGSSGYYAPESPTPSTSEEPASKPRAVSPVDHPVEPQPAVEPTSGEGGHAAVGVATPVALPVSPQAADASSAPPAAAVVGVHDRVASGSGGLPLPILLVGLLILVYAGARLLLGPVEPDLFRSGRFQRVRRAISRV